MINFKTIFVALLLLQWSSDALAQTPSTRERVSESGPYRSQVRLLQDEPDAPLTAEQLLERSTDDYARALVLRQLGLAQLATGNYDEAIAQLQQAITLGSLAPLATAQMQANLGQLYFARKDYPQAAATLQASVAGGVTDSTILITLAAAQLQNGNFAAAATAAHQAIGNAESPSPQWLKIAIDAYWRAGRHNEAIALQRMVLESSPDDSQSWSILAALYREAGDLDHATATLSVAARSGILATENDYIRLVQWHLDHGTPDIATKWMQTLIDLRPQTEYWLMLAQLRLRAHDDAAALDAYLTWARRQDTPAAWLAAGELAYSLRRDADARTALSKASSARAAGITRSRALLLLGQTYVRLGSWDRARRAFVAATEYGGTTYQTANQWLDALPTATEQVSTETADAAASPAPAPDEKPQAEPVQVNTKTVPSLRVYGAGVLTTPAEMTDQATRLARSLIRTARRQRLELTGSLQIVIEGDVNNVDAPLQLEVAVPIRRVAPAQSGFRSSTLESFRCAWVRYSGPWDGLEQAWRELSEQTIAAGFQTSSQARQIILHRGAAGANSTIELQIGIL